MKSSQVITIVGKPARTMNMVVAQWWIYDDADSHTISIMDDTVANCVTAKEAKKAIDEANKEMDSLQKNIK